MNIFTAIHSNFFTFVVTCKRNTKNSDKESVLMLDNIEDTLCLNLKES